LTQANVDSYIEAFGGIRPLIQVKIAERRRINTLLPLFEKYNIEIPENIATNYISKPSTLSESIQQCIIQKDKTIKMYKKFTSIREFPDDILRIFEDLASSSKIQLEKLKIDQLKYK